MRAYYYYHRLTSGPTAFAICLALNGVARSRRAVVGALTVGPVAKLGRSETRDGLMGSRAIIYATAQMSASL